MVPSYLKIFLAVALVLLPIAAKGDDEYGIPPVISPFFDQEICTQVNCGKGSCRKDQGYNYNFRCRCEDGWKRTTMNNNEDDFQFLPCTIPDCSLDYSCMPAPPPPPPLPFNFSSFDPCYGIYCGEGACIKNTEYTHVCQCNYGYNNILGIPAFPCFSPCALGSDCSRLGIKETNSSFSSPFSSYNQATSILPRKSHWIAVLLASTGFALWK